MLDNLREQMGEFAADTAVKHVVPSIIVAHMGLLSRLLYNEDGHRLLSDKSIHAVTGLAILAVNYAIHLWFFLKRKAAEKAALERR